MTKKARFILPALLLVAVLFFGIWFFVGFDEERTSQDQEFMFWGDIANMNTDINPVEIVILPKRALFMEDSDLRLTGNIFLVDEETLFFERTSEREDSVIPFSVFEVGDSVLIVSPDEAENLERDFYRAKKIIKMPPIDPERDCRTLCI